MDEYLSKSGKYSRYMMRESASTQLSVDFKSEKDMAKKLMKGLENFIKDTPRTDDVSVIILKRV